MTKYENIHVKYIHFFFFSLKAETGPKTFLIMELKSSVTQKHEGIEV